MMGDFFEGGRMKCSKCDSAAMKCIVPSGINTDGSEYEETYEWLCTEHAEEDGYCWRCGHFSAGQNGFDFLHKGLCDNCHDEVMADNHEDNDDEDCYPHPDGEFGNDEEL